MFSKGIRSALRPYFSNLAFPSCIKYPDINSKHSRVEWIYQEKLSKM